MTPKKVIAVAEAELNSIRAQILKIEELLEAHTPTRNALKQARENISFAISFNRSGFTEQTKWIYQVESDTAL